jgi:hypothetical protein
MRVLCAPVLVAVLLGLPGSGSPGPTSALRVPQSVNSPVDLVQTQLVVPRKVTIGKVFRVLDEVENQGKVITPPSVTGFFLSEDAVFDAKDISVGGRRVPRLGASQSHSTVTPVTLKSTIKPGEYYFLAVADARRELEERSRDDNVRAVHVTVLPAEEREKK